ncbi:hypothetical protein GIB67_008088 [Kingdonia uniflora]|uniref:DUF7870 domain-containing protein n=1 Tax=Kingdonia uniflora TaxID=39325 RepID=A0A7J7MCP7_9MAGN|nr:hypothetical protein GIB67_008088 [Kingdonia uniflora]
MEFSMRYVLLRLLLFGLLFSLLRFTFFVTIQDNSCNTKGFCFISPNNHNFRVQTGSSAVSVISSSSRTLHDLWTSKEWRKTVNFYSSVFMDLMGEGYIGMESKVLCVETVTGEDVFALKEIGVRDVIGVSKKAKPPLVRSAKRFDGGSFDVVFSGGGGLERRPFEVAAEIEKMVKIGGFVVVVLTKSGKDDYSYISFLELFTFCRVVKSRDIDDGFREIIMRKEAKLFVDGHSNEENGNECSVRMHKQDLVRNAEPLIVEEPLKPWLTLKINIKNVKYLPSMADISFKRKYVYVDVGARSYGSSIGSWFKKHYPKQNKTFEIYAIEADKTFHEEYRTKKGVNLLPYAAWLRNETLFFEINRDPGQLVSNKGRGMGRIQPVQTGTAFLGDADKIKGFDFANWLKNTVSERDFVVMKMDVEGTEFDLIPRLFETGAICLIDEVFLECHYNRWQRCCPGERSPKYQKTYNQCLELFSSLRKSGVLVHQWW